MVSLVTERLGFADLVSRLSSEAPRRDRDRMLFTDLRPELRASRIGAIRLPRADGSRLRLTEFFQFILDLAIADSNLAHSLRNHYVAVENAILEPTPSSPQLLALAAEGLLFGGAAQEQTGSSGSGAPGTKVEQVAEDEYLVSCRRYYSTGSVYADRLILSVTLGGVQRTVLIESDRPGVGLPDDWDGFGQRLTGSGSLLLDRVRVTSADVIERPVIDEDQPRYPVIQAVIGVASAKAFAATATISAAAALLEQSWDAPRDFGLSLEATLAASRAKITVESLTLDVIDALTQVASGSTLSTERALDRHWRNLKVLASHNPSIYKHQVLGAYELHGTQPPLGVYF
jgi:alkylation response protein AidB-like acyl-CoA dehydrogenase